MNKQLIKDATKELTKAIHNYKKMVDDLDISPTVKFTDERQSQLQSMLDITQVKMELAFLLSDICRLMNQYSEMTNIFDEKMENFREDQ